MTPPLHPLPVVPVKSELTESPIERARRLVREARASLASTTQRVASRAT